MARRLRTEITALKDGGHLSKGKVGGGKNGTNVKYTMSAVRGDMMVGLTSGRINAQVIDRTQGYFSGKEKDFGVQWQALPDFLKRADTLISELSETLPELANATECRGKAMVYLNVQAR